MSEEAAILNPRVSSLVAVVAFTLGLMGTIGFFWSIRSNANIMGVVSALEQRDVKAINEHRARINEMAAWEQRIADLEQKVTDLEASKTDAGDATTADVDAP